MRGNEKTDALYKEHTAMLATFEVPQDFKSYFAPASTEGFWVYKDEANNSIRSLYLKQFSNSFFRVGFSDHNREWMESTIYSDNKKDPAFGIQLYAFSEEETILSFFLPDAGARASYTDRCLDNRQVFKLGDATIYGCGCKLELMDQFEVNGKTYQQVIKVTHQGPIDEKGLFQTAWFAPGIGLIRQDMGGDVSLKLVRSNVK